MAKEVQVFNLCDGHAPERVTEGVQEFAITVNGTGPLLVDLCPECQVSYLSRLQRLLSDCGQKPDRELMPAPARVTVGRPVETCIMCGFETPNRSSLGSHMRDRHRVLSSIRLHYGACPVCGESFPSSITLGRHFSSAHPDEGALTSAMWRVLQAGDPERRVAPVLKRLEAAVGEGE